MNEQFCPFPRAIAERCADEDDAVDVSEVAVNIPDDEDFAIVLDQGAPAESWTSDSTLEDHAPAAEEIDAVVEDNEAAAPNKLQQFVGKCKIQLAVYNPLPPLCRALQESHFPLEHEASIEELKKHPHRFWDRALRSANDDDLLAESDLGAGPKRSREDLMIKNLAVAIQLAFRQSVLRVVLLTKCSIALVVCMCIAAVPFKEWREHNEMANTWLPHVMLAASTSLYVLTLGLLYGVRFDFPINGAVMTFLLCVEVCCLLLVCLNTTNLNAIATVCVLFTLVMACLYLFATYRWKPQATDDDFALLHPMTAAILSVVLVFAGAIAVYHSSILADMSPPTMSPSVFAGVLVCVALGGLWTGLTLHCMSASLTPDEHTRCLVFYHSDVVVTCGVVPLRWTQWLLRRWIRMYSRRSQKVNLKRDAALSALVRADHHGHSLPGDSGDLDPVEDARHFKDYGEERPAAIVSSADASASVGSCPTSSSAMAVAGGGGDASRRRSSFAEPVQTSTS